MKRPLTKREDAKMTCQHHGAALPERGIPDTETDRFAHAAGGSRILAATRAIHLPACDR
jgi:hypothetical protein